MMRIVVVIFGALILWGSVSYAAEDLGVSKWISAIALFVLGFGIQTLYARVVKSYFDSIGLTDYERNRLKSDKGIAPFWIRGVGNIARIFLTAGSVMPILEALGCYSRG